MLMCDLFLVKFCEIWKSYGIRGPEEAKVCEILSHSVRYGMYVRVLTRLASDLAWGPSFWLQETQFWTNT